MGVHTRARQKDGVLLVLWVYKIAAYPEVLLTEPPSFPTLIFFPSLFPSIKRPIIVNICLPLNTLVEHPALYIFTHTYHAFRQAGSSS